MNEQNWELAQGREDLYGPSKLPFFNKAAEQVNEEVAPPGTKEEEGLIKLNRVKSQASGGDPINEFTSGLDPEVDTQLRDMLYDKRTGKVACSEHEPLLLQLPGTLPFAEIKPHSATALEEMIHRLSDPSQSVFAAQTKRENEFMDSESNNNNIPELLV